MNGPFYIGATGLHSQEIALGVVANNIANLNTPAYKRSEVRFSEIMAAARDPVSPASPDLDLAAAMSGVSVDASPRIYAQGGLKETGKPLDIAISGDGFLELMGPAGQSLLWRGGALKINPDGLLAADNGMPLKASISIPEDATAITIDRDGKVRAVVGKNAAPSDIGQLEIVKPKDAGQLSVLGDGLYRLADGADIVASAPGEDGAGVLVQGSIETSNVQLADEMVMLLLLQRAYGANAQVVQAGDQLMAIANNLKR